MHLSLLWLETAKNGLVNGALIALLAVAFSWIYRTTRVFHITLGAQILAGAYAAVYFSRLVQSFALAAIAGVFASIAVSMVLMRANSSLQRREASNALRLIASVGLYFMAVGICAILFGPGIKRGSVPLGSSLQVGPLLVSPTDLHYTIALITVGIVLMLLVRSPVGMGIAAVGSNRRLYSVLGHAEGRVLTIVHITTGVIAGFCGAFEGLRNGVEPYGYLPITIFAAVAALLGGRSLFLGPIIAGLVLGCLKSIATQTLSDAWIDTAIYGILLIAVCFWPRLVLAPAVDEERP